MRCLEKNQRTLYYSNPTGKTEITDAYGCKTGEYVQTFSTPKMFKCNISANAGNAMREFYGISTNYARTLAMQSCPFNIGSRIWIGESPSNPHNYEVVRIADSVNFVTVAVKEVDG